MRHAASILLHCLSCRRPAGLLLVLWLVASIAAAEPQGTFSERLDVVQVEVDLVVTDKSGRPVTDLTRDDLEIYHGGARYDALYLTPPSNHHALARAGEVRRPRQLVIYVDHLRIWPKRRNTLLRQLDQFIDQRVARGDRVSIVTFNGSVELFAVDSLDPNSLRDALDIVASQPTAAARIATEARQLRLALAEGVALDTLMPHIERHIGRLRLDAARSRGGSSHHHSDPRATRALRRHPLPLRRHPDLAGRRLHRPGAHRLRHPRRPRRATEQGRSDPRCCSDPIRPVPGVPSPVSRHPRAADRGPWHLGTPRAADPDRPRPWRRLLPGPAFRLSEVFLDHSTHRGQPSRLPRTPEPPGPEHRR